MATHLEGRHADPGELDDFGRALDKVLVGEHGEHHVAARHQDRLVRTRAPVVQSEEDVGEETLLQADLL